MQNRERENALIAQRIKKVRKELKLGQVALAERLGLDQTTISKWENGKARPTPDALVRIAALASDMDKLFFLGYAGLPSEYLDGGEMISEIRDASTRVVSRAFKGPVLKEDRADTLVDRDALDFVLDTIDRELEKRRRKLPYRKYAEAVVLCYTVCRKTGTRDADTVIRLIA